MLLIILTSLNNTIVWRHPLQNESAISALVIATSMLTSEELVQPIPGLVTTIHASGFTESLRSITLDYDTL